jgi:AraC-like DNA-binding protein
LFHGNNSIASRSDAQVCSPATLINMARWVPALTVQAVLEAFRELGLDERRLRVEAGVPGNVLEGGALLPAAVWQSLWASVQRDVARDEIGIEAGLALPFGAFGLMDYLAASAPTLGTSCEALSQHFHRVSCERSLELEEREGQYRIKLVVTEASPDTLFGDEFALGAIVGRLRARVRGFSVAALQLRRPPPRDAGRFAELLGAPVSFGHAVAALCLPEHMRDAAISSADPWLRRTLESLLPHAALGAAGSPIERSLRDCLKELLPKGRVAASRVAAALGMSERSLHRRLREIGQSYQGMVDVYRREEAERLLLDGRVDMSAIAHRLGFADQSAFSRAFRRWTQMAPRAWLAQRSGLGSRGSDLAAPDK